MAMYIKQQKELEVAVRHIPISFPIQDITLIDASATALSPSRTTMTMFAYAFVNPSSFSRVDSYMSSNIWRITTLKP